ncbi:MAG: TonB-dependent receptor [Mariniphaga sp.]
MKIQILLPTVFFILAIQYQGVSRDTIRKAEYRDTVLLAEEVEEITIATFHAPFNFLNTPAPIQIIIPEALETGSAFTPVEALNQVPGILMHHGTLSTNRLTIRGIGSRTPYATNKVKAYFGEIPITGGDGATALEDIENRFIQRIEIIKGPSSSLYGAGLGGVILFYPKSFKNNTIENQTTRASFNTWKNTLSAGFNHKKLNTYLLGSVLNSDGYRENNNTNRVNFMLHSEYALSNRIIFQALLKMTKMKAFIPSSIDLTTYLESPQKAATNWKDVRGYEAYSKGQVGLSAKIHSNKLDKISLAAFGSVKNTDELRPFNLLQEDSEYFGWRGYIQKIWHAGDVKIAMTSGIEFFRENYRWSTRMKKEMQELLSDNLEKRSYENLFLQMETNFRETLYLSTGLNGNFTRFRYTDRIPENGDLSGRHAYPPVISPRLGANYHFSKKLTFFGNISHGFSTPSFEETLLPEGEINAGIQPESGWNTEAGIRVDLNGTFRATVSYYRMYIKNLLVARRTGEDAYVGVNAGRSIHPGLEADIKWIVFNPHSFPSLSLNGNITAANYRFQEFNDQGNDYSGNLLPGTSRITWLAAGKIRFSKNMDIRGWHRHTGKMPVNDSNSTFTKPSGLTNIEIRYSQTVGKVRFELKTGVENIFDVKHISMLAVNAPSFGNAMPRYYYPGHPRNYFLSLQLSFNGLSTQH